MKTPDLIGAWLDLTFEPKHPWLTTLKPDHLMNEWWPHSLAAWNITLHYAVQQSVHTVQYSTGAQCLHGILAQPRTTCKLQATCVNSVISPPVTASPSIAA